MRKMGRDLALREERSAFKFILPSLIILLAIAFYPFSQVFYYSMTDKTFASGQEEKFVGMGNYKSLLGLTIRQLPPAKDENGVAVRDENNQVVYERATSVLPQEPHRYKEWKQFSIMGTRFVIGARDTEFMNSISNTLVFTIFSVLLETILGLIIALVVNSNFRGKEGMRTIMLIPWAIITVVSAKMWGWMFAPSRMGLFNTLAFYLGIGDGNVSFLTADHLQLPSLILIDVWKTTPYMALLILAGLQMIPSDVYEAADIDGANPVKKFFLITLPLLKPSLGVALIFRTLDALRVFDVFQVLLGNRKYSMASYNYYQLVGNRNMGLASAIGVVIFIFIFMFAILFIRAMGVNADE